MAGAGAAGRKGSWVVAGGLAGWARARACGVDHLRAAQSAVVPLLSFTPQVARAAPVAALGVQLTGRRGPAVTATRPAAGRSVRMRPRRRARPQPAAGGPRLTVLTLNLFAGQADAEAVVARGRAGAAGVLVAPEAP